MTVAIDPLAPMIDAPLPSLSRRRYRLPLAATAQLLTEGGDDRIAIDPARRTNRYGCKPEPDAGIAAFGSSTASVVSEAGFAAADRLRRRLQRAGVIEQPSRLYARELERMREELTRLCGLAGLDGTELLFAASGTDLHLLAAQLCGGADSGLLAVTVEPAETGSGVPMALAGCHFGACTALGDAVPRGAAVAGARIEVAAVSVRARDGTPLASSVIDAEIEALVAGAAAAGRRVLLTLVDVSKTGLIAPSPGCALALRRRFPAAVDVLVDACQFRLAPATLRAYLEHGFMVALTGSKFLTGPAFSGVLAVAGQTAARLAGRDVAAALGAYAHRAELPRHWQAGQLLGDDANFGLLLRWEAALTELRAFRALPEAEVAALLATFARAIAGRLADDPAFEALPVPALDRAALVGVPGWDAIQTIFPFLLRRPSGELLTSGETERVYRRLGSDVADALGIAEDDPRHAVAALRGQLGQPVMCGLRDGHPMSALRLCASVRLAVEAASSGADAVVRRALAMLDKVALLVGAQSRGAWP